MESVEKKQSSLANEGITIRGSYRHIIGSLRVMRYYTIFDWPLDSMPTGSPRNQRNRQQQQLYHRNWRGRTVLKRLRLQCHRKGGNKRSRVGIGGHHDRPRYRHPRQFQALGLLEAHETSIVASLETERGEVEWGSLHLVLSLHNHLPIRYLLSQFHTHHRRIQCQKDDIRHTIPSRFGLAKHANLSFQFRWLFCLRKHMQMVYNWSINPFFKCPLAFHSYTPKVIHTLCRLFRPAQTVH